MTMKSPRAAAAFSVDDLVVYPTHGVGQVTAIENQVLGGQPVSLIVITFERERMTLRVPMTKAKALGLRRVLPVPSWLRR